MLTKDLIVLLAGFLTGAINSIGGGGMLVGFPVLMLFGMPAIAANATANIIALSGQITSSIGYHKYIKRLPRSYLLLLIPSFIGATIGAYILRRTTNTDFEYIAPVLILIAVLLFAYQPYIHSKLYQDEAIKPHSYSGPKLWVFLLVFPLAVYGGYFGLGFGLVMLAILSLTRIKNVNEMNGLKNLTAVAVAVASIAVLFDSHLINWHLGLLMSIGSAVGGYVGARSAPRFSFKIIRFLVLAIGVITAIYLTVLVIR
jgi:uncharacterized membrane protein YfcA